MSQHLYPIERKLIIVTVISDLRTDYRVHKICQILYESGFNVLLIGSAKKRDLILKERDYQTDRIKMWFDRTIFFYIEFNIRLYFRLLKQPGDIYLGNDLDVMAATLRIARMKKKQIVYDSHEYFTGQAGLEEKPVRRKIWETLESRVFAHVKYIYTVSDSISNLYHHKYHKKIAVVRNLPFKKRNSELLAPEDLEMIQAVETKIPPGKNILLLQGAGINAQRGAEELVLSMAYLDSKIFHLLIIGGGDHFEKLKIIIAENHLSQKITLIPKVPFSILGHITQKAQLGFSIDNPSVINHRLSLPNKLFEYLHAGVPVLASRLAEQERIIKHYDVGGFIEDLHPEHIAQKIKEIFADPQQLNRWKLNTSRVREELNWENESKIVLDIFKQVEKDSVNI